MAISKNRKVELRNYLRLARSVLHDETLKSPNVTKAFYRSIRLKQFSVDVGPEVDGETEFLKKLILACARRYKIDMPRIKVKYSWLTDNKAAHVIFRFGVWYIEVDDRYCADDQRLTAIIAHEMSHIVLGKHGVTLEPTLRNEELTDAVAVLAGFGSIFHAVCLTVERSRSLHDKDVVEIKRKTLGYLKRGDIECLLRIKEDILSDRTIKRWYPIKSDGSENMHCYACDAEIRVPARKGIFRVKCSVCGVQQFVRLGYIYKGTIRIIRWMEYIFLHPILWIRDLLRGYK